MYTAAHGRSFPRYVPIAVDQYYSLKSRGAVVTIFYTGKHSECHKHKRVHNCGNENRLHVLLLFAGVYIVH